MSTELIHNNDNFRDLVEKARDCIVVLQKGNIAFANSAVIERTGYSPDELLNKPFANLLHSSDRHKVYEQILNASDDSNFPRTFFRIISKNGSIEHFEANFYDTIWNDRQATFIFMHNAPPLSAKDTAPAIKEREFSHEAEKLPLAFFQADRTGRLNYCNSKFYSLLGYSQEEFEEKFSSIFQAVEECEHKKLQENIQKIMEGDITNSSEHRLLKQDGGSFTALLFLSGLTMDDESTKFNGIIIDISRQKINEHLRSEREGLLRLIIESVRDAIRILDLATWRYIYANPYAIELFGYNEEEYVGASLEINHDDASHKSIWKILEDEIINDSDRDPNRIVTFELLETMPPLDKNIWTENRATFIRDSKGRPDAILIITRDITSRKETELSIRESEELFRMMIEEGSDLILILEKSGTIIYQSPSVKRILGYEDDEMIGKDVIEFIHTDDLRRFLNTYTEIIQNSALIISSLTIRAKHKDESWRLLEIKAREITTHQTMKGIIANCRDITDRKKIEEELHKAQKLESLGLLAGGIAHDFNNILTSIIGNITLAKMDIDAESETFESLLDAEKASFRAKDLTLQLLTFSRGGAPIKKTTSLVELIQETITFTLRGTNIKCDLSIADDLWLADIDEGQISQVLNNLVVNAIQSMDGDGKLDITARNKVISPLGKGKFSLAPGCYVSITIKDYGVGIPEDLLQKIFDPYFTTKKDGSGLGLSTVYSIMKNHSGHVEAESHLDHGTTFNVFLPASEEKSLEIESVPLLSGFGEGKILLMDDNAQVLNITEKLLSRIGYQVVSSMDGAQAFDFFTRAIDEGTPFDLVILDLTIQGGLGGKATMEAIRQIDKEVKAIVASGYSENPIMSNYKKYGFDAVIKKPFQIDELNQIIHTLIKI